MKIEYEIVCIKREKNFSILRPHGAITDVGYIESNSSKKIVSIEEAIDMIENKNITFFVKDSFGNKVEVKVVNKMSLFSKCYLRTEANGQPTDNLEHLPFC